MAEEVPLREYLEKLMEMNSTALGVRTKDLDRRLEELNNLRAQVIADRGQFLLRDTYQAKHDELTARIDSKSEQLRLSLETAVDDLKRQIDDLKRRFAIFIGVGLVLVPMAGLIGAAISKAFRL